MKKLLSLFVALFALCSINATTYSYDFKASQQSWTISNVSLDGLSSVWQQTSQYGMKASAYDSGVDHTTESWLVSPVLNLSGNTSATLQFNHARRYGSNDDLSVRISRDGGSTWSLLSFPNWPNGNNWTFIDAGTVDISAYISSSTKIAFVYTSTSAGAATWEISNVQITATAGSGSTGTNTITYTAAEKLTVTTDTYSSGLHTNAFNVSITSHTFSNGTGTITFSGEVTSIGDYAFRGCSGLTSITIPDGVTSIGDYVFRGCSGLTSITIPDGVTSIGNHAFDGCSGLTSITIPNSVTSIGEWAFSGCSGLTFLTIPNSVTSIGESAFKGCSAMRKVVMGSAIASIGSEAFAGCTGLIEMQVNAVVPPLIDATTFNDVSRTLPVYVPGGSIDSYRAAQYWNEFNNLKAQTLPQATLTLNADSEMGAAYGAGTYDKGSDVQIFAIDNSGYEFTGWSDGNTDNPRTLRLTDNLTLTANFEKIEVAEYTINVSAINPALGTATASEFVLVEAVPYPGCTFVCWSDGNFENPRYIPLTGDINLQAIFSGTPTSVAETTDKAQGIVRKVIVDGQLHIIRDDKTYTVEGSVVK